MNARATQRDRVLHRLQAGLTTVRDFMDMGISRFGARIWELRKQGFEIVSEEKRIGGQRHVTYRLERHSSAESSAVSVVERSDTILRCAWCGKVLDRKSKARPLLDGEKPFCSASHRWRCWRRKNQPPDLFAGMT